MIKNIAKEKLAKFISEVNESYPIYLPTETKDGLFEFKKATSFRFGQLKIDYPLTRLAPTDFFFPLREETMEINNGNYNVQKNNGKKLGLYGVESYDMKAINRLDKIMEDDFHYQAKRKNTLIIAISTKNQNIFDWVLTKEKLTGYDLLLKDNGDSYLVISNTKLGDKIMDNKYLDKANVQLKQAKRTPNQVNSLEKISWAIEKTKGNKVWQYWADKCLGCGNCSYVCPLCYCYQINDQPNLEGNISRLRTKSSCFLYSFDKMSSGNPKENFIDRFYHWYYHKFVAMPKEYGFSGCVNCGRCIRTCPAGINFKKVLNQVIESC